MSTTYTHNTFLPLSPSSPSLPFLLLSSTFPSPFFTLSPSLLSLPPPSLPLPSFLSSLPLFPFHSLSLFPLPSLSSLSLFLLMLPLPPSPLLPPPFTFSFLPTQTRELPPLRSVVGASVLLNLGDSVTTDHISPAGSISRNSPAARYLAARGWVPTRVE